jgi:Uma2 family endonuclease
VKLPIYARSGIPEVWIVDTENEAIYTYREPKGKSYTIGETKRRGESVSASAFPTFIVTVDDLLGPQ